MSGPAAAGALLAAVGLAAVAGAEPAVRWQPPAPRPGDPAWVHVRDVPPEATVHGSLDRRPLHFFPYGGGWAALTGIDVTAPAGVQAWRLAVVEAGRPARTLRGSVRVGRRAFPVQQLTLPRAMVDLDPATERRALDEAARLRAVLGAVTPERLWRGSFTRPVAGTEPGTGFGARRVINGRPRAPHTGLDYSAPRGTPVVAANHGRVALVGEFFFPGRLVVLDHGLGLYTFYFHLDTVAVAPGAAVERGQTVGTVGASGRATGPHLHFGAQVGAARIDPAQLLGLAFGD